MKKYLISPELKQYKANMHSHSTLSDGRYEPEFLKESYKARGYSVFAYSDHGHVNDVRYLADPDFIPLLSCELDVEAESGPTPDAHFNMRKCFHYNVYVRDPQNIPTNVKNTRGRTGADVIAEVIKEDKAKNLIVSANHPGWSLYDEKDFLSFDSLDAIEIGNSITSFYGGALSFVHELYLCMLRNGNRVLPLGGDDNHSFCKPFENPNNDSFKNFTYILSDKLEYGSIIDAIDNGDVYYSQGPQFFEITADGDDISIKTSGVRSISVITDNGKAFSARAHKGETVDALECNVADGGKFFVVYAVDNNGKAAISRGFFKGEDY